MNYCRNEKGIALMLALILSFIALSVLSVLVYFITTETQMSGIQKRYHTAREAALGAIQLSTNEFIPTVISGNSTKTYPLLGVSSIGAAGCFQTKLLNSTSAWAAPCSTSPDTTDLDPLISADVNFRFDSFPPAPPFRVSLKVVDTIQGNTDTSGLNLGGLGVVEGGGGMITPGHNPYYYRMEVAAKRCDPNECNNLAKDPPGERANLSVLYGY